MSNITVINEPYENEDALENLLAYILRVDKNTLNYHTSEVEHYGLGVNCLNPMSMIESFRMIKRFAYKMDGKQLHHFVLTIYMKNNHYSLRQRDLEYSWLRLLSAEVSQLLYEKKGYQNIFALHNDTNVVHVHFMINSINYKTGKREKNLQGLYRSILYLLQNKYNRFKWEGIRYHEQRKYH